MLDANTKRVLSKELSIEEKKLDYIIDSVFDNISKILLKGKPFYIQDVGTISVEDLPDIKTLDIPAKSKRVVFYPEEEKAYYSLQTLALSVALECKEDEKNVRKILKNVFFNIKKCLDTEKKCIIKSFGSFHSSNSITFLPSFYLEYLINPCFNLVESDKNKDVIEEYIKDIEDSKNKRNNTSNISDSDILEEILDSKENTDEKNIKKDKDNDYISEVKIKGINVNVKKNKQLYKNVTIKQKKSSPIQIAILFVVSVIFVLSVLLVLFYHNVIEAPIDTFNNIVEIFDDGETQKLQEDTMYDISKFYFIKKKSEEKKYKVNKDTFYWRISKNVYGSTIYWPLIYALNINDYQDPFLIKKDSILNIAEIKENKILSSLGYIDKDLSQTLSNLYFSLYHVFTNRNEYRMAKIMIVISAKLDRNTLEERKYEIPLEIYDTVSADIDNPRK